jgi:NACalpha-BTF3-like transcription factor
MEVIYDPPVEGGPQMKIRNPIHFFKEREDNRKRKSESVYNKKTRAMEIVSSDVELTAAQRKAENEDFCDYVIEGIENFKLDGKVIKCNRETKVEIMNIPIVTMYVHRCIELLQESGAKEEAEQPKNLSNGSSSRKTKLDPE